MATAAALIARPLALHGGFAIAAVGLFLPWSRIGGETRSGFETANVLLSLAANGLPEGAAWVARCWYLGVVGGLAMWAIAALATQPWMRHMARAIGGTGLAAIAVAVMITDQLAGVATRWWGPVSVGLGVGVMLAAVGRQRERHIAG
jgi:hypothetical protein